MLLKKFIFLALLLGVLKSAQSLSPLVQSMAKNYLKGEVASLIKNIDQSNPCVRHMFRVAEAVQKKEMWALRVLDSFSKINPGLLDGNLINQGIYDECININNPDADFRGQYCSYMVQIFNLPMNDGLKSFTDNHQLLQNQKLIKKFNITTIPMVGTICVPDVCTAEDLTNIYQSSGLPKKYPNISFVFADEICSSKRILFKDWTVWKWLGLSYFLLHFALMLLSTSYDYYLKVADKKPLHQILLIYSVKKNTSSLFRVKDQSSDEIRFFQGMRALSMMWIILGHRYILSVAHANINALQVITEWFHNESTFWIFGAHLSVDTFFFISGVLVFYIYFLAESKGVKFNIFGYLFHRYIRLTPSIVAVIICILTWYEDITQAPLWEFSVNYVRDSCVKNWWKSLLYFQNFLGNDDVCLGQTWYLGVDTQLYVIAPIFFLTIGRWPKIIIPFMGLLVLVSSSWGSYTAWKHEIALTVLNLEDPMTWMLYSYTQYRAGVWLIGAILGFFIFKTKEKIVKIPRWANLITWAIFMVMMTFLCYTTHLLMEYAYQKEVHAFVFGYLRIFWALGLCWMTYACYHGYGGFITKFLSCNIFVILGRLTYSMYIVHVNILFITIFSDRVNTYFSDFIVIHNFWGDLVNVTVVAFVWNLAFEAPLRNLSNILLGKHLREKMSHQEKNGNTRNAAEI